MTVPFITDTRYEYEQNIQSVCYDTFKSTLHTLPVLKNKCIVKPMNSSEIFYEASQLLSMISRQRAIDFTSWLSIGSIIYNVSNGSSNGLDAWISFSSINFTKEICCLHWSSMKPLIESSIHTLAQYAQEDTIDTYQNYKYTTSQCKTSQLVKDKLYRIKVCHFGEVLYLLCKYEFLYDDKNGWYQWKDNKWNSCTKECRVLRNFISMIKEMMFTEYKNMYNNYISPLQNIIRDIEEKEETSTEDIQLIKEHYKKVTELEEKRTYLMTICDKLDELGYKNKIIKECTDLFYDTDGIISHYLKSQNVHENIVTIKQTIQYNDTNTSSPLKLFVINLITTNKCKQNIISLTNDELISKCTTFCKKYNLYIKINHTLPRQLNALHITGITVSNKDRHNDINKTEFDKKAIKDYLCL